MGGACFRCVDNVEHDLDDIRFDRHDIRFDRHDISFDGHDIRFDRHDAIGAGMRIKVHVPVPALLPAAMVMDKVLANPPVTPAQLRMLARHNITRLDAVRSVFGFEPASFRDNAGYLAER